MPLGLDHADNRARGVVYNRKATDARKSEGWPQDLAARLLGPGLGGRNVVDGEIGHPVGGDAVEVRFGQLENATNRSAVLVRHPVAAAIGQVGGLEIPAEGDAVKVSGLVGFPGVQFMPPDFQVIGCHAILPFCLLPG